MPAGRHSFSRRWALALASLVLTGCAGQMAFAPALAPPADLHLTSAADSTVAPAAPAAPLRLAQAAPASPPPATVRFVPAADHTATADLATATAAAAPQSPWCRYLRETAAADAMVLRSPSLGANSDDSGHAAVTVGMSFSAWRKAQLTEQQAEVKCRRYVAENSLQKQLFLATQQLTAAGLGAKAATIASHRAELETLRKRIRREVADGNMTADRASALTIAIDQLYAAAAEAKSQAERRLVIGDAPPLRADVEDQIIRSEQELQDIDSQMRTADAFDVGVEGSYASHDIGSGFDSLNQGLSGKVKLSIKLGAFLPQRFEHEAAAKSARIEAMRSEDGGVLWQARVMRESHQRALAGLNEALARIDRSMANATTLLKTLASTPQPELSATDINARIQYIQLAADRAGVVGSINEIRTKIDQLPSG